MPNKYQKNRFKFKVNNLGNFNQLAYKKNQILCLTNIHQINFFNYNSNKLIINSNYKLLIKAQIIKIFYNNNSNLYNIKKAIHQFYNKIINI